MEHLVETDYHSQINKKMQSLKVRDNHHKPNETFRTIKHFRISTIETEIEMDEDSPESRVVSFNISIINIILFS